MPVIFTRGKAVMRELAEKIEEWIRSHREEFVSDLISLVNIRSVSTPGEGGYAFGTGCKECADAFMELGERYGFLSENDDYYCASILLKGKGDGAVSAGELGILGHLDVVPEGEGWHYEPYQAIERDGYVIGRGSGDNKGGTLMSLYAMRCLRDLGYELNHTVRLIAGFNEESGMKDVVHYLAAHTPPKYTIVCDGGWAMCIGEKGIVTADLVLELPDDSLREICGGIASNAVPDKAFARVGPVEEAVLRKMKAENPGIEIERQGEDILICTQGKAAHAFMPHTGINAIYRLFDLLCGYPVISSAAASKINELRKCFPDDYGTGLGIDFEDQESGKTTCIGGMIRTVGRSVIQNINIRYAVTQDGETLLGNLGGRCEQAGIRVENTDHSGPRMTSPEEPVVKLLLDTYHEFMGRDYEPYVMGGGTHARVFPNALPYGPAEMGGPQPFGTAHGIDEAVNVDRLLKAIGVYVPALIRLDQFYGAVQ